MKKALTTLILFLALVPLLAQVPYERWFQGIIYGSNGRVLDDGTALVTGQFYPSSPFLVRTDMIGMPVSTRFPTRAGRYNTLMNSQFTSTGEVVLLNGNTASTDQRGGILLSKWDNDLDTLWAYAYNDTAFDVSYPDGTVFLGDADGYVMGFSARDTVAPFAQGRGVAFVDVDAGVQWAVHYPTTLALSQVIRANDGGYLGIGSDNGIRVCFKTDATFAMQWYQQISSTLQLRNERIVQGTDDMVHYFVGIRDTVETINSSFRTYSRSMAWLDLDPATGELLNTREVDFRWPTLPTHLMRTSDGNFLAAGMYTNNSRLFNILRRWEAYVLKLDASGNMIWADTLSMNGYRSRVVSMDEHNDRLLIHCERYDDINPFHQYFVLDTEATPICDLARTDFHALGTVDITAPPYTPPAIAPTDLARTPFAWTIGTNAMNSLHLCGGITTEIDEEATGTLAPYPDPAHDQLHLGLGTAIGKGTITVTDLHGRIVLRTRDAATLDVSGLVPGVYVLSRTTPAGNQRTRFVKE